MQNLKTNRVILFRYISAIELDLRNFVKEYNLPIIQFEEKINKRLNCSNNIESKNGDPYLYLDFGDYYNLIVTYYKSQTNIGSLCKNFLISIEKLIPIRNRVMHTRPLEDGDSDVVFSFVKDSKLYSSLIDFTNLNEASEEIKRVGYFNEVNIDDNLAKQVYIEPKIENNLPLVDYDDTGFVGRDEKKKEIIKKLNSAHPIISVIGNGGIGKTSTVLSCIYDIIDDPSFPFEKVLWVSLKTKSLQDGEFKDLKNSLQSFDECIQQNKILHKEAVKNIDSLLYYMSVYKTLLILDNLETIDSNDVKNLFEDIPYGSKILITSRIGIREYETRLTLGPFTQKEAVAYFKRLAKCYNAKVLLKKSEKETSAFVEKLYFSPLCIKWFVLNVAKGNDPNIVVNNQGELIEFCLSNVYDKLSDNAKKLLTIIFIQGRYCLIGELIYLNDDDYPVTMESINEVIACNFLEQTSDGRYEIPEFASQYLAKIIKSNSDDYYSIQKKVNRLNGRLENMIQGNVEQEFGKPNILHPSTPNEYIATLYMMRFQDCATKHNNIEDMDKWFDLAQKSAPRFCDIYKVAGYSYGKIGQNNKADTHYKIALELADNDKIPYIFNLYAVFLINNLHNYDLAFEYIDKALKVKPSEPYFLATYVRALKFSKNFDKACDVITQLISRDDINYVLKRSMYSEYIDIKARKYDCTYDLDQKDILFKETYRFIEDIPENYFYFPFYKGLKKFMTYLLDGKTKNKTKPLIQEFGKKYFDYMLFACTYSNGYAFVQRMNELMETNIDFNNYEASLANREYGFIKLFITDKGYGKIQIKGSALVFFHISKVLFPIEEVKEELEVSFIPKFEKGRWQATAIEKDEDEENEE